MQVVFDPRQQGNLLYNKGSTALVQHLHSGAFICGRYNSFLMCSVQQGASIDPLILEGLKALPPKN
jgi:hypothetical protein